MNGVKDGALQSRGLVHDSMPEREGVLAREENGVKLRPIPKPQISNLKQELSLLGQRMDPTMAVSSLGCLAQLRA